jgi:hypothetical protein
MSTKHALSILAAAATASVLAGGSVAASAPGHSSLVIRHQLRGCHSWSVSGGPFAANQTVALHRGGWLTVTNNDVMPHKLVKTSGPVVSLRNLKTPMMGMGFRGHFGPGMMAHMGAKVKVTFSHAGVYRFTTKAGEDYMAGMKTVGEDNVLHLTVKVS